MKAVLLLVLLIVATGFAFYLVWMNRGSEKIVTAVIPIAIAALIGVALAVFVFGGEAPITVKFPAVFLFRALDKAPWVPPSRPVLQSLFEVPELQKDHPELMSDDTQGATLYHHLLQKVIIDILCQHHQFAWETDISRFDIGFVEEKSGPSASAAPSTQLSGAQIQQLLRGNRFAQSRYAPMKLALPRGKALSIKIPQNDLTLVEEGEIVLANDFVHLSITTRFSQWMRSLGPYRLVLGYSWEQDKEFHRAAYLVTIHAEFNRLRSGHPDMPKYKNWVDQIISELQTALDEQLIWAKTKENYLFTKQLEQFGAIEVQPANRPLTLNPPEYR
jgi:hypothetical protein